MLDGFVTMFYAFLHTIVLECVYDPYIQNDIVPFFFSRLSRHSPCSRRNLHPKIDTWAGTRNVSFFFNFYFDVKMWHDTSCLLDFTYCERGHWVLLLIRFFCWSDLFLSLCYCSSLIVLSLTFRFRLNLLIKIIRIVILFLSFWLDKKKCMLHCMFTSIGGAWIHCYRRSIRRIRSCLHRFCAIAFERACKFNR